MFGLVRLFLRVCYASQIEMKNIGQQEMASGAVKPMAGGGRDAVGSCRLWRGDLTLEEATRNDHPLELAG